MWLPEDASSRSSLLTNQSKLSQNKAQLERFPRIREADPSKEKEKDEDRETTKKGNQDYR